jgi:hypothetical protein
VSLREVGEDLKPTLKDEAGPPQHPRGYPQAVSSLAPSVPGQATPSPVVCAGSIVLSRAVYRYPSESSADWTASSRRFRPCVASLPRWIRIARRPCLRSASRSPWAWACFNMPKV